jgi:hypothetical protein
LLWSAHLSAGPFHFVLRIEGEIRNAFQPFLDRNLRLQSAEVRTDAAVNAKSEGDVAIFPAIDHNLVGFGKAAGSRLAAEQQSRYYSLVGPENAPSSDVFGHNPNRRSGNENTGRHFDSGAARDLLGSDHGSASNQRSADHAKGELSSPFETGL